LRCNLLLRFADRTASTTELAHELKVDVKLLSYHVRTLVAAGAIEQVRRAQAAGVSPTARVALGFEELLDGDVDAMKRRTRRYARRQLTWMRKLPDVELHDISGEDPEHVAALIDSAPG
jgi:tRNA dimethylallyltransferase